MESVVCYAVSRIIIKFSNLTIISYPKSWNYSSIVPIMSNIRVRFCNILPLHNI